MEVIWCVVKNVCYYCKHYGGIPAHEDAWGCGKYQRKVRPSDPGCLHIEKDLGVLYKDVRVWK